MDRRKHMILFLLTALTFPIMATTSTDLPMGLPIDPQLEHELLSTPILQLFQQHARNRQPNQSPNDVWNVLMNQLIQVTQKVGLGLVKGKTNPKNHLKHNLELMKRIGCTMIQDHENPDDQFYILISLLQDINYKSTFKLPALQDFATKDTPESKKFYRTWFNRISGLSKKSFKVILNDKMNWENQLLNTIDETQFWKLSIIQLFAKYAKITLKSWYAFINELVELVENADSSLFNNESSRKDILFSNLRVLRVKGNRAIKYTVTKLKNVPEVKLKLRDLCNEPIKEKIRDRKNEKRKKPSPTSKDSIQNGSVDDQSEVNEDLYRLLSELPDLPVPNQDEIASFRNTPMKILFQRFIRKATDDQTPLFIFNTLIDNLLQYSDDLGICVTEGFTKYSFLFNLLTPIQNKGNKIIEKSAFKEPDDQVYLLMKLLGTIEIPALESLPRIDTVENRAFYAACIARLESRIKRSTIYLSHFTMIS
eukprot:NODE_152_length_15391_cov_0.883272.p1 type:complete len:480 gc:universal NODE_152_length_15391_cov_0.883272:11975-10536(-)